MEQRSNQTAALGLPPPLLTAAEVARLLRVSKTTVHQWSRGGLLPCVTFRRGPGRVVRRWREDAVAQFIHRASSDDDADGRSESIDE